MRKYLLAVVAALALASAFIAPAKAHHCWSQCDANGSGHCSVFCD